MPQPNKIPLAFAASGDKNVIPESTETTGLASWREGFPAITSAPFSEGGIAPKRADFNGIFNALSQSVIWLQQGGVYAYDVNTDYEAGNVVLDAGGLYVANAANGPSSAVVQPSTDATGATWKLVRLDLATQSAAGYMSAADKTKVDSVILTDATPTAAGYMSGADKTKLDGLISTDATPTAAGYMSGADKTKLDGLISTNATQTAAGYMSAADKTKLDGLISTNATQSAAGYMSSNDKALVDSIPRLGTFNKMFFSQISGNFIAPRTGVYRITLKGGGGGGGGTNTSQYRLGAGGGEGGELIFYVTLTKDQSYSYVIGAGGTAGTDSASSPTNGGNGGATSFNSDYSVAGGKGGDVGSRSATGFGGAGGLTYNVPAGTPVYFKPGIAGQSNIYGDQSNNKWLQFGCTGGGRGGCDQQSATGIYGGGGRGTLEMGFGGTFYPPTAGGAGYILIEYAG